MKCLSGTVKETRYAWPEKKKTKMTETGYTVGMQGDVMHINGKDKTWSNWSANTQFNCHLIRSKSTFSTTLSLEVGQEGRRGLTSVHIFER